MTEAERQIGKLIERVARLEEELTKEREVNAKLKDNLCKLLTTSSNN